MVVTQLKPAVHFPCCSLDRVASLAYVAAMVTIVFNLGICIVLVGSLRRTHDMCNMSLELQRVGVFTLISLGEFSGGTSTLECAFVECSQQLMDAGLSPRLDKILSN